MIKVVLLFITIFSLFFGNMVYGMIYAPILVPLNHSEFIGAKENFQDLRVVCNINGTEEEIPIEIIKRDSEYYLLETIQYDDGKYETCDVFFGANVKYPTYNDQIINISNNNYSSFKSFDNDIYFEQLLNSIFNFPDIYYFSHNIKKGLLSNSKGLSIDFNQTHSGPILDTYTSSVILTNLTEDITIDIFGEPKVIDFKLKYYTNSNIDKICLLSFNKEDWRYNISDNFYNKNSAFYCLFDKTDTLLIINKDVAKGYIEISSSNKMLINNLKPLQISFCIDNPNSSNELFFRVWKLPRENYTKNCDDAANVYLRTIKAVLGPGNITEQNVSVDNFLSGGLGDFSFSIPRAEISLFITPKKDFPSKEHNITLTYKGATENISQIIIFDDVQKKYIFKDNVYFTDGVWMYPFDKHKSIILTDSNTILKNETKPIITDPKIIATARFDQNQIEITVSRNLDNYIVIIIAYIVLIFPVLLYIRRIPYDKRKTLKNVIIYLFGYGIAFIGTLITFLTDFVLLSVGIIPFIIGLMLIIYCLYKK